MGNFYTNFSLKYVSGDRIAEFLTSAGRAATVCPERDGWVVVCLEETEAQHPLLMEAAARDLSRGLGCVAIGVLNHDDDVLAYWVAVDGRLVDQYVSHPGALEGRDSPPEGGNARVLAEVVGRPDVEVELGAILHPTGGGHPPFAMALHEKLTQLLGLPPFTVGLSYMSESPLPDELDDDDIIEVP